MSQKTRFSLVPPFFAMCLLASTPLGQVSSAAAALPPHPRLLLDAQGIADLKRRVDKFPWAKKQWSDILHRADEALKGKVELPPRGGSYYHFYIDPINGQHLSRGKEIAPWHWEHKASDGKIYRGDPTDPKKDYDGYSCLEIHFQWTRQARDLGLAYQMTGDKRYAARVRDILLAYCPIYLALPRRNHWGLPFPNSGHIATHMLSEALWLIPLVEAADLVWNSLSSSDRKRIAEQVLRPCCRDILIPQDNGPHNRQAWKNTAVGLTGLLLDDADLLYTALDEPQFGHRALMKKCTTDVGFWIEGSWSYHYYTLSAIVPFLEATRHCGINLYDDTLKRLYDAPFRLAAPSGQLPAFNDSHETSIANHAANCELAYARYHDPLYLELLDAKDRHGELALFYGVDDFPAPRPRHHASANFPTSGYTMLTRGAGPGATWLCLKYGPHGGAHSHPDKASFVLYARGRNVAVDPGMAFYGAPIHKGWYQTTLAHNTLTVDQKSQAFTTGRSLAFGSMAGVDYVVVDAGTIAGDLRFIRTAALLDSDHLVFIDQIHSPTERTLDLVYHQQGQWALKPQGTSFTPPDLDGYRYLTDARIRPADGWRGHWQVPRAKKIDLTAVLGNTGKMLADLGLYWKTNVAIAPGPGQVITALGVGSSIDQRVPMVIFRRHAGDTAFCWGLSLDEKPMEVELLPVTDMAGKPLPSSHACAVRVRNFGKSECFLASGDQPFAATLPGGTSWQVTERFAARRER